MKLQTYTMCNNIVKYIKTFKIWSSKSIVKNLDLNWMSKTIIQYAICNVSDPAIRIKHEFYFNLQVKVIIAL